MLLPYLKTLQWFTSVLQIKFKLLSVLNKALKYLAPSTLLSAPHILSCIHLAGSIKLLTVPYTRACLLILQPGITSLNRLKTLAAPLL